jgi:hypothetical protein
MPIYGTNVMHDLVEGLPYLSKSKFEVLVPVPESNPLAR